jgi:hypothetical protein
MNRPADIELHAFRSQLIDDVTRVTERSSQTIQFRHDESVALPACRKRDPKTWAFPVSAGQTVIGVDIPFIDAQLHEGIALRGQILFVCGYPRVSDE